MMTREETEQLIIRAGQPLFLVHASDLAKEFVYSCLTRKSHLRPSAWQLLRFPWIKVRGESSCPLKLFSGDGVGS